MGGSQFLRNGLLTALGAILITTMATAQGISDPTVRDSGVGYIDPAIPMTTLRLRFDALYNADQPSRAEFFYPQSGRPGTPGLPLNERRTDFQEVSTYLEYAPAEDWSLFVNMPVRMFNGQVNDNSAGIGDIWFGGKYALLNDTNTVLSLSGKVYVPTGDSDRGLGNNHVTLEPGILVYQAITDQLILEGEICAWIPIGGTFFAGNILRYGIGLSHRTPIGDEVWIAPVGELVAWTVLDGKENAVVTPAGVVATDASGDTILNAKLGVRVGMTDVGSVYFGYGRALTGDVWYRDTLRVEVRLNY